MTAVEITEVTHQHRHRRPNTEESRRQQSESLKIMHEKRRELQTESLKIVYEKCLELEKRNYLTKNIQRDQQYPHIIIQ